MLFGNRRVVPLYVAAALAGIAGSGSTAFAQTIAPPAPVEAEAGSSKEKLPTLVSTTEADTVTSQPLPTATVASSDPSAPASAPKPEAAPAAASPADVPSTPAPGAPGQAVAGPETATSAAPEATGEAAAPVMKSLTVDAAAALGRVPGLKKIDRRDRDGLLATYKAREGRPIWMTARGATRGAIKLAAEIGKAGDWGLDKSGLDVPELAPASPEGPDLTAEALADAEIRLSLATLRYARQARGGRFEPTDLTPYLDRKSPLLEPQSVLEGIATAAEPDAYLRKFHPQHPQFELLRQRYLAVRDDAAPKKGPSEAERILANMEEWRWMPADLGKFHAWVNIPEQLLRVVRDGRVINTERIVVGKPNAQTPIFSHEMKHLIFHPFWGVPDSIKTNELLPALLKGRDILGRQNLRLQLDGKDVDPRRYDWTRTDIRRFHVYQPPSSGNALGVVKFMFPNKHAVYMHDTPSKSLFKASVRAFSHGCMRVQDPIRFAELILEEDKGMSPEKVRALARPGAPENNQINLSQHIPVHMVYFTMWIGEGGKVESFKDIYGHEERIRLALDGKMNLIKPVSEPKTPTDPIGRLVEVSPEFSGFSGLSSSGPGSSYSSGASTQRPEWARRAFSSSGAFSGGN
ncbi:MAG: L,D-transpeptidase family protein [Hyphomicrobiaceae bacterium]